VDAEFREAKLAIKDDIEKYTVTLLFSDGWSFSRSLEGQKEMYGTGIAFSS
jgi:hypothetical protein